MRALRLSRFGLPSAVLQLEYVDAPEPRAGEVRVRLTHRPINPSDVMTIQGLYAAPMSLPGSPGFEGVGTIDAIGPDVNGVAVGQRVVSLAGQPGTWAEQIVIPAMLALPVPDALSDELAAQLLVNPMSAYALLTTELVVGEGDWILQTAASSTLGRLIIQLAQRRGIRLLNVVRRRAQVDELLGLGANAVVCTEDESLAERVAAITGPRGVSAAIDAVGGDLGAQVAACLAPGGTLVVVGMLGGQHVRVNVADLIFRSVQVRGFWLTTWFGQQSPESIGSALTEVMALMSTGVLHPLVEAEYDLADFQDALAHAARSGRNGKVLLRG